eukprot:CAMPEP_0184319984 /NCGR_PEP_ID=MMETSP1049-20130417/111653_1 /TAXON_ID=77928 /ORGANISM="Proteomonas sulcata, Strain CCMP704" /LENGTH=41 /DNA_ID= /DNA_START= /DNA_END= /DNA_ORIENTATION=
MNVFASSAASFRWRLLRGAGLDEGRESLALVVTPAKIACMI